MVCGVESFSWLVRMEQPLHSRERRAASFPSSCQADPVMHTMSIPITLPMLLLILVSSSHPASHTAVSSLPDRQESSISNNSRNNHKLPNAQTISGSSASTAAVSSEDGAGAESSNAPVNGYYGTLIGRFDTHHHDASGEVYAIDESSVFIRGFSYDGTGPDAYFWAGASARPDASGFIIPDEKGSTKPLGAYRNKDLVLRLPEGRTFRDIRWIAIWCRKFTANFAHLTIPRSLIIPAPIDIPALKSLAHGVKSGPITIVDAQTILVPDFHYDGEGPAAHFWVTRGAAQSARGIRLLNENGSETPLRKFTGETVVVTLPDDKTVWNYDWFGVWCESAGVDFGSTAIPMNVRVPPSPKMLGVRPENKLNCEVLYDDLGFELRWVMDGDDIVMQLVGRVDPGEYMAFGLGKDDARSDMTNTDAVVAWIDAKTKQGFAVDYFLGSKEQCVGTRGACPDLKVSKSASDSITLLHSSLVNGFSMITFKRPQLGVDEVFDQHVYSDGQQAINWAIGPLNNRNEISFHRLHSTGNYFIDFARTPKWNCPSPDSESSTTVNPNPMPTVSTTTQSSVDVPPIFGAPTARPPKPFTRNPAAAAEVTAGSVSSAAWDVPPIICPADRTFRAQIGPTGGKKGYQAITGKVGWGIAWYMNGLLIPELVVQRGKTYTFIVEGGNDPIHSSRRHPLYITDSPDGGYDYRTDEERAKQKIFAGAALRSDGQIIPTAEGRLCEWKNEKPETSADNFSDFFSFQRTLNLQCLPGKAAVIRWTPDASTPDTVYYQCWTHRLLGWKIRVVDSCENIAAASNVRVHHVTNDLNRTTSNLLPIRNASPSSAVSSSPSEKSDRSTTAGMPVSLTTMTPFATTPGNMNAHKKHKKLKKNSSKLKLQLPTTVITDHSSGSQQSPALRSPLIQRPATVHFNLQPQLEAWMYQPGVFSGSYDPHPPHAASSPTSPVMTFEPFYLPSYQISPMDTERPGVYFHHKVPAHSSNAQSPPPAFSSLIFPVRGGSQHYSSIRHASHQNPGNTNPGSMSVSPSSSPPPSPHRYSASSAADGNNNRNRNFGHPSVAVGGFQPIRYELKPRIKPEQIDNLKHESKNNNNNEQENRIKNATMHLTISEMDNLKYNISRYGYPYTESNRVTSNQVVTGSPPESRVKLTKNSVSSKIKNTAPVPYLRPIEMSAHAADHMITDDRTDSRMSSSIVRPTHADSDSPPASSSSSASGFSSLRKKKPFSFSSTSPSASTTTASSTTTAGSSTSSRLYYNSDATSTPSNSPSITVINGSPAAPVYVPSSPPSTSSGSFGSYVTGSAATTRIPPTTAATLTIPGDGDEHPSTVTIKIASNTRIKSIEVPHTTEAFSYSSPDSYVSFSSPSLTSSYASSSTATTASKDDKHKVSDEPIIFNHKQSWETSEAVNLNHHNQGFSPSRRRNGSSDASSESYDSDQGISYNPIYSGESANNISSPDHTILNHILSLIAVGETPPEVKVFTKPTPIEGAFSTHVEVHQRYPRSTAASSSSYSPLLSSTLHRNRRSPHHDQSHEDHLISDSVKPQKSARNSSSSISHLSISSSLLTCLFFAFFSNSLQTRIPSLF